MTEEEAGGIYSRILSVLWMRVADSVGRPRLSFVIFCCGMGEWLHNSGMFAAIIYME